MTNTIDKAALDLSAKEWDDITDAVGISAEDTSFTDDELSDEDLSTLIDLLTKLGAEKLKTIVSALKVELSSRLADQQAFDPHSLRSLYTTTTTTTTTTTSAPPPAPTNTLSQAQHVTAPADDDSDVTYPIPEEHTKLASTLLGNKLPLRKKNLVDLAVKTYYGVNREDVVKDIKKQYAEVNNDEYKEKEDLAAVKSSTRPAYKDTETFIKQGTYPPHWPEVPAGDIPVHKGSIDVFTRLGHPGQAFTGIVRFGGRSAEGAPIDPKIILFPTQSEGEYLAVGVRRHPEGREVLDQARVYQKQAEDYTTHSGQGNASSHGKLSALVAAKQAYANLAAEGESYQSSGMTIGFTVIRGGPETAHKFTFVSRSSNDRIFGLVSRAEAARLRSTGQEDKVIELFELRKKEYSHLGLEANGAMPAEWAEKITESVQKAMSGP